MPMVDPLARHASVMTVIAVIAAIVGQRRRRGSGERGRSDESDNNVPNGLHLRFPSFCGRKILKTLRMNDIERCMLLSSAGHGVNERQEPLSLDRAAIFSPCGSSQPLG
jgi:hypothetical protein